MLFCLSLLRINVLKNENKKLKKCNYLPKLLEIDPINLNKTER